MNNLFTCLCGLAIIAAEPAQLSVEKLGDVYEFKVDGTLVTKYHTRRTHAKPYLWPLMAPGGISLSRDWPMKRAESGSSVDHPHQRSAWIGHGDVIPEEITLPGGKVGVKGVDFWSEGLSHGKIECLSVDLSDSSKGILNSRNAWKTTEGRTILQESREIRLRVLDGAYLIDIRMSLTSPGAVTFGDTKEGTFAVRLSDQLCLSRNPKSTISLSDGRQGESGCWGQKADWCNYAGEIGGQPCGIAIFDDPKNRCRACWHVRGYGLMAANPFGRAASGFPVQKVTPEELVRLKAGESLTLRYGLLLYTGRGKVSDHYRQFLSQ